MMEMIFACFVVVLSVTGAVAVIKWAAMALLTPVNRKTRVYAVLLKDDNADIELQMAIDAVQWEPFLKKASLFAVDCGLSEDKFLQCAGVCKGTNFKLITSREFFDTNLMG